MKKQEEFNSCLSAVSGEFKLRPEQIMERNRRSPIRESRVLLVGMLTKLGWVSEDIAVYLGDRNSSTIRSARARHDEYMYHWSAYRNSFSSLMEKVDA